MISTKHTCPICDWSHTEPMNDVPANALAGVFGMGVMANIAISRRNERIEEALSGHLKSHPVLDWVKAVTSRDSRIRALEEAASEVVRFNDDDGYAKSIEHLDAVLHPASAPT